MREVDEVEDAAAVEVRLLVVLALLVRDARRPHHLTKTGAFKRTNQPPSEPNSGWARHRRALDTSQRDRRHGAFGDIKRVLRACGSRWGPRACASMPPAARNHGNRK